MGLQDQVLIFPLTNVMSRQLFGYDNGEDGIWMLKGLICCNGGSVLSLVK